MGHYFDLNISITVLIFSADLRPKGRGRPQRILLGNWPDEHVRQVIRAVVFRDGTIPSYNHAANFTPQSAAAAGPSSQPCPTSPR